MRHGIRKVVEKKCENYQGNEDWFSLVSNPQNPSKESSSLRMLCVEEVSVKQWFEFGMVSFQMVNCFSKAFLP